MAQRTVHARKAAVVEALAAKLESSRVVGLADPTGIPGPQMQSIRARLRPVAELQIVKNRLLLRALEAAAAKRKGLEVLEELVEGQTAVVLTEVNPFKLFKELEGTKTKAPAKGGDVAPEDIAVQEGDTPFKPGPVVGDLQRAGIPAAIERGKVVIKKDKVLVEAGQRIPTEVAQALTRLEIFPMTVGLDLRGVFEEGALFTREALDVDEEALRRDVVAAAANAFRLAVALSFPTPLTTPLLLSEAHRRALYLALATNAPVAAVLPTLLARAHGRMLALARRVPEALDEELQAVVRAPSAPAPAEEAEESPAAPAEEKEEKEEKPEGGDDEEEAAEGLSSLFG